MRKLVLSGILCTGLILITPILPADLLVYGFTIGGLVCIFCAFAILGEWFRL